MPTLNFTKRAIDALPLPKSGQVFYRDSTLRGLGMRAGCRSKVYYVEGQVNGRTKRVTLGRADVLSVDTARKRALAVLNQMATGTDPNAEKRRRAQEGITLKTAFERFFETRKSLAASTVEAYCRSLNLYLRDWGKSPITKITRQAVLKRHQRIAKDHGQVTANNVMRHLRSVYNVTAAAHDEFPPNPVTILTQARAWFPERRRRTAISARDLPAWWVVAAALTVLRAYVVAGMPNRMIPLGSFEGWNLVREALVWLGEEDPAVTRETVIADDPRKNELAELLELWAEALGGRSVILAELADEANKAPRSKTAALHQALAERTYGPPPTRQCQSQARATYPPLPAFCSR